MKINRVCVSCNDGTEHQCWLTIFNVKGESTAHNYDQERFESKCSGDYLEVVS